MNRSVMRVAWPVRQYAGCITIISITIRPLNVLNHTVREERATNENLKSTELGTYSTSYGYNTSFMI
jgi:hypothetical protein